MGGAKGGSQTIGYRYYMTIHAGISRGPIDELVQINAGDVRAWPVPDGDSESIAGEMMTAEGPNGTGVTQYEDGTFATVSGASINTARSTGNYSIRAANLFGGDKKEGGISGSLRLLMGNTSQVLPAWIKTLMGGRVPEFRGVATFVFDGLLCSINPYPKAWKLRARRVLKGWDGEVWQPDLAAVWMRGNTIKAMNGAHILYECLTNRDWGRGLPRSWIKDDVWTATAQTLFNENFGLCLRYTRQSELSSFIQDVLDHIGGSLYPDRATGQLSLELLRGDYDLDSLPLFTYDTGLISLEDDETASQDEVVNEVVVKWHDPITNKERQSRVQNLAAWQTSGGAPNSTTTSYSGIPTSDLSLRMAQRDVKANANSLKRYKVVLDRRAWRIVPGQVFRISVPDRSIFNAVLRAGKVSEAGGTDGRISVEAVLDVFGLPSSSFVSMQPSDWTPPDRTAQIADRRMIREATYPELVRAMDPANLAAVATTVGTVSAVVAKPNSLHQGYNVLTRALGEDDWTQGVGNFSPFVIADAAISPYQTTIAFTTGADLGTVTVGSAVQIGDEIARLDAISVDELTGAGTIEIARGCVDTYPQAHSAGSTVFLFDDDVGGDGREYASGEIVEVRVCPYTSSAILDSALAPIDALPITARQGRPFLPGNLIVNGAGFADSIPVLSSVSITWAHRNRLIQQDQLVAHDEGSIIPEAGATCTIRIYDGAATTPVRTVSDLTATAYTYTATMAAEDGVGANLVFELLATRDGMASFNIYRFPVTILPAGAPDGYGEGYGNSYGN